MIEQNIPRGSCLTKTSQGTMKPACQVTLRIKNQIFQRKIKSIHLSRPEDYLSIYCSGCNHNCLKCHSAEFSKNVNGKWISNEALASFAASYLLKVTVFEPKKRATMWHADELCLHCGSCVIYGIRSEFCPQKLSTSQIVLSPQGFGPARNIIAFTGGDLVCRPDYYFQATRQIKEKTNGKLWVLIETNGYACTRKNLKHLRDGGVDSFWLDIKTYEKESYQTLCGTSNSTVLKSLSHMVDLGFTVEVLTLFIPSIVESDQHKHIAKLVADIDPSIPMTLLAFFPSYMLMDIPSPSFNEMISSYIVMRGEGLKNIRLGNLGVFAKTKEQQDLIHQLQIG